MYSKLVIARREARVKQVEIAKYLNITHGTYCLKETGRSVFTLSEAISLAKYFNKSLDDLFGE